MQSESATALTVRRALLHSLAALAVMGAVLQFFIDGSVVNLESVCWVLASTFAVLLYIGATDAVEQQPLSSLSILGFCITTQFGALIAQTIAWTPLRSALYEPVATFSTLAGYEFIAIFVHRAYCYFSFARPVEQRPVRSALRWAGVYEVPPVWALWIMGLIGLSCILLGTSKGIGGRVADGFRFLAWAPFLSAIYYRQIGPSYCNARLNRVLLTIFSLLVIAIAMGLNIRQIMFFGLATVGLLSMLSALRNHSPVKREIVIKLCVATACVAALSGPFEDLATAMAVARAHRGKISAFEMASTTLDVWQRPYLISAYRASEKTQLSFSRYDEMYIANPILARFVETKFHDNALHFAGMIGERDREGMVRFTVDSLWAVLPQPALEALNINISKVQFPASVGDYLAFATSGIPMGGWKTGSMFAQGRLVFGYAFPVVYALICLLLYAVMDLLTDRSSQGRSYICAIGMMKIWQLFIYGVTDESFEGILFFICRDIPQCLLGYCILLQICKFVMRTHEPAAIETGVYGR